MKNPASAAIETTIRVECQPGTHKHTLEVIGMGTVYNVAFSLDGKTLASGSEDDTILLWDVDTGRRKHAFSGHHDLIDGMGPPTNIYSVAFSPDGKTLASGGRDTIYLGILDIRIRSR